MQIFNWIYRILRWGLGGIFIYAGSTKLGSPEIFATLIEAYGLVPESLVLPLAVMLPILEIIAGLGLMLDIHGSLFVIAGLLVLFIAVLSYGLWLGLDVDCGCFGPEDPEAEAFHGLNVALQRDWIMLAGVAFIYGWRRFQAIKPLKLKRIVKRQLQKRRINDDHD